MEHSGECVGITFPPMCIAFCCGSVVTHLPKSTETGRLKASVPSLQTQQSEYSVLSVLYLSPTQLTLPTRHIPHILRQTGAAGLNGPLKLVFSLVSAVTNSLGKFVAATCEHEHLF